MIDTCEDGSGWQEGCGVLTRVQCMGSDRGLLTKLPVYWQVFGRAANDRPPRQAFNVGGFL